MRTVIKYLIFGHVRSSAIVCALCDWVDISHHCYLSKLGISAIAML